MTIEGYGITLRLADENDIEMILKWRNSEHIRRYALQKETITLKEHTAWFHSQQIKGNLYFIVETGDKPVGLIWAKDFSGLTCETGFYLYETDVQNTLLAYKVSLNFNNYLFHKRAIESIYCDILNDNKRSIRFTLSLGYEKIEEMDEYSRYVLHKESYSQYFNKISKLLLKEKR